ncbi:2500_t:CDS:2, partial [Dentiscutata heterogama]
MKDEIHKELTNYFSIILEELLLKKSQEINVIDDIINHQSQTGYMKKCSFCQISDINNKKWVCPKCHNKLPTISKINQQVNESSNIKNTNKKSLVTYSNRFKELDMQESVPEVLEHVEEISGIKYNRPQSVERETLRILVISR